MQLSSTGACPLLGRRENDSCSVSHAVSSAELLDQLKQIIDEISGAHTSEKHAPAAPDEREESQEQTRIKKNRSSFTKEQKRILNEEFYKNGGRFTKSIVERLASSSQFKGFTQKQIMFWNYNVRSDIQKEAHDSGVTFDEALAEREQNQKWK